MKQLFLFFIIITNFLVFSQEALPLGVHSMVSMYQDELTKKFGLDNIIIDDNLHIKNYAGSPLLLAKWSKAEALFNDGKYYKIPNANYDALDDIFVIYLKNYNDEFNNIASKDFPLVALASDNLIAIALTNDEDGTLRFVQVSPGRFISQPKTKFFQYFTIKPKDALVLKSVYKKVKNNHLKDMPYSDSPEAFEFKTFSTYYIKNKNKIFVPLHLGKKAVLKAIGDSAAIKVLKKYIKTHHLKMTKPENVQKLLEYYFEEVRKSN